VGASNYALAMAKGYSIGMHSIIALSALPENIDEFISEMARGYGALYGESAADWYRDTVGANLEAAIGHGSVDAFAAYTERWAGGIAFCHSQHSVGHISFVHVLERYAGEGMDGDLVRAAARRLRERGAHQIVCEVIPFFEAAYSDALREESFTEFNRCVMAAPLSDMACASETEIESRPLEHGEIGAAASILVNAYESHPDRILHCDIHSERSAERYIRSVLSGDFGYCEPGYCHIARRDGESAGLILGFEASPTVGFVMQVAVTPDQQGNGIGTALLADLAGAFLERGVKQLSLGVTLDNPAQRLYERLGLRVVRNVQTYIWDSDAQCPEPCRSGPDGEARLPKERYAAKGESSA
jgi:ribosomal protein S18 acetylase RimI-like enzyme